MAAEVEHVWADQCSCCGLPVVYTKWTCGCLRADFDRSAYKSWSCDSFSDKQRTCHRADETGKWPDGRHVED